MNHLQKLYDALKFVYQFINNSFRKLVASLESRITFDERFKITSVPLSIPDVNLLSCELDNITFILSHFILILYWKI